MSDTKKDGGPAFPNRGHFPTVLPKEGMSLRDWFAGMILANPQTMALNSFDESSVEVVARRAYAVADAMIAESEK